MKISNSYYLFLSIVIGIYSIPSIAQTIKKKVRIVQPVFNNVQVPDSLLNYVFKDSLNRDVRLSDFKGKYILIDFWYSGCGGCIYVNNALREVHHKIKAENFVFISLSIDGTKEMWIQGITKGAARTDVNNWAGKYWPAPGTVALYTGGSGYRNSFIQRYVPSNSYPQLYLIDPNGKIITNNPPRPDVDMKAFLAFINANVK